MRHGLQLTRRRAASTSASRLRGPARAGVVAAAAAAAAGTGGGAARCGTTELSAHGSAWQRMAAHGSALGVAATCSRTAARAWSAESCASRVSSSAAAVSFCPNPETIRSERGSAALSRAARQPFVVRRRTWPEANWLTSEPSRSSDALPLSCRAVTCSSFAARFASPAFSAATSPASAPAAGLDAGGVAAPSTCCIGIRRHCLAAGGRSTLGTRSSHWKDSPDRARPSSRPRHRLG